jgi:2,4-dienoyl-CoA reductase-like NADH-dependent reductase (Old Yellow Enzyme family)
LQNEHRNDGYGWAPKSNREEEKKMNKQMTPWEIELVQQGFARLAPISDKAGLVGVESGPWPPPPNIPAAIAPASVTMK